jgi:Ca-activated chloride channel homolog
MIGNGGQSIWRLFLMLAVLSGMASFGLWRAAGQSDRPRRVGDNPVSDQSPANPTQQGQPQQPTPKPAGQPPVKPQDPKSEEDITLRIDSRLVAVPVSVTDVHGNPVRNLKAEDFVLEEDGQAQQVQSLGEPGKTPIELALLFDVSKSLRSKFDFEREAAGRFLREALKRGDAVTVFSIGRTPQQAFARTDSADRAIAGIQAIQPTEESTAFFDTVVKAARHLQDTSNPETRRVIVTLSDGEDTSSQRFVLNDALREVQRAEAVFYAINPSGPSIYLNKISVRGNQGMQKLAEESGGVAFLTDKVEDLQRVFSQITAELQAQYLLGYYSPNEARDGKFRRISVRVPKQSELRVRAKNGYFAPKDDTRN